MNRIACWVLPLLLLVGCGASAKIEKLSADLSDQQPILQVWTKAKHMDAGSEIRVLVGWNRWQGTGNALGGDVREDGTLVVNVADWKPNGSDWVKSNEMRVEFTYEGKVIAKRNLPAATEFTNALLSKSGK